MPVAVLAITLPDNL